MGAQPRWCTLALALPNVEERWLAEFSTGLFALADEHSIELIGGDTTRGPLTISITALGTVPAGQALRRDGAQPGDDVWVSGQTGEAALGLAHLQARVQLDAQSAAHCLRRKHTPSPRIALGMQLRGIAASAADVSDGLLADLGHILERSHVGAQIDFESLPRSAVLNACPDQKLAVQCLLAGGDDYELVFSAGIAQREAVLAAARAANIQVTRIGRIVPGGPVPVLQDAAGRPMQVDSIGFDHFK
jgi:thiamine-monophosphate kinase